ncbi:Nramp family divalent metal transporter [Namhaeicola litoreus]|uniref:Nramp family divalent metal transporter n=1 Tax=Namhaeicola litoreus TaxID=1052145 RepID=A0ABW3XXR0_9FLAO
MIDLKKCFGPSTLVAAAFIGPGTLTTCTIVGVQTGYQLLWAMLFSIFATIVLQEMSARLGFATQSGLGEALNKEFPKGIARYLVFFLVIGAILIGNAAYEAGNISGGVLGLDLVAGEMKLWPVLIGFFCFLILFFGRYKWVEKILIALVIIMSICFLITAILVQPNIKEILKGFIPSLPSGDAFLLVMALIGTTVVPYNLFLHASTISKKWSANDSLKDLRIENAVSILLGGLISVLIIITAASSADQVEEINSAKDLAIQLEPLFGKSAKWFMGIGLMAAGISSALTAPLAAAYAAKGLFSWKGDEKNIKFRLVWMIILLAGVFVSITNLERVLVIKFAQITNAILLPFVAVYLLYISNSKKILNKYTNSLLTNILGVIVILFTLILSLKTLNNIFHFL